MVSTPSSTMMGSSLEGIIASSTLGNLQVYTGIEGFQSLVVTAPPMSREQLLTEYWAIITESARNIANSFISIAFLLGLQREIDFLGEGSNPDPLQWGIGGTFGMEKQADRWSPADDSFDSLITKIKEAYLKIEKVQQVREDRKHDNRSAFISVFVDMPEYNDKLMDQLIRMELNFIREIRKSDFVIEFRYLPSSIVDPKNYVPVKDPFSY